MRSCCGGTFFADFLDLFVDAGNDIVPPGWITLTGGDGTKLEAWGFMVVENVKVDWSEISWTEPRNEVSAGADTVGADTVWADTVGIYSSKLETAGADSAGGGIAGESSG